MKKSLVVAVSLASAVLFSGCATIINGKTQKINVTSTPSGKQVSVGGKVVTTPAIIDVRRSKEDMIVKSTDCGGQKLLASKINPVFFVNILSGGAFGSTTDYSTDSMWKYDDNVNLNCQN